NSVHLDALPDRAPDHPPGDPLLTRQLLFGYTQEDIRITLSQMGGAKAEEPLGSMGNDNALAVLSDQGPPLYNYFKQLFAQVTNPPIDPIREKVVMSLSTAVGAEANLLDETPEHAHQLVMSEPLLTNADLEKVRQVDHDTFCSRTLDATWPVADGVEGLRQAMDRLCAEADAALDEGVNILVLSDRAAGRDRVPVPALLATAGVHHHLVRNGTRLRCGLVVESGEPREVHHFCTLIGYGASAVNPYLAFESLQGLIDENKLPGVDDTLTAEHNLIKAAGKGILKTISKMGISTVRSYCGAQIFEAVGLEESFVEEYFTGTTSRIGGIGLDVLAVETLRRHRKAYPEIRTADRVPVGGYHQWRRGGEHHMWSPDVVATLQHATRAGGNPAYDEYARMVNEDAAAKATIRGLLEFNFAAEPVPIEEVEPAKEIVKRFATGAMSLGSLSREAHETLAIAMNRLGGKSNTGEGGEDSSRFTPDPNGDLRRSAIKQVASGRFGVTIEYLVNADELQIKMAQGAKPGEGGQLPGHKVDDYIAFIRNSTPGVGL
ncbi:MAG: glutamate synthase central domain-containing protein, partial [Thermoleophilaceae bacterium]